VVPIPVLLALIVRVGIAPYPTMKLLAVLFVNPEPKPIASCADDVPLYPQKNEPVPDDTTAFDMLSEYPPANEPDPDDSIFPPWLPTMLPIANAPGPDAFISVEMPGEVLAYPNAAEPAPLAIIVPAPVPYPAANEPRVCEAIAF
jgi:hypothetical protein